MHFPLLFATQLYSYIRGTLPVHYSRTYAFHYYSQHNSIRASDTHVLYVVVKHALSVTVHNTVPLMRPPHTSCMPHSSQRLPLLFTTHFHSCVRYTRPIQYSRARIFRHCPQHSPSQRGRTHSKRRPTVAIRTSEPRELHLDLQMGIK